MDPGDVQRRKHPVEPWRRIVYVGYHPDELGGISQVTAMLLTEMVGLNVHPVVLRSGGLWPSLRFSALALLRYPWLLLRKSPSIAHILIASPVDQVRNTPYIILSRLAGLRVVVQFRYDIGPAFQALPRPARAVVRCCYRAADRLAFLSKGLSEDFEARVGKFPSCVIPNPVDPEYLHLPVVPFSDRRPDIVFLGRFQREKGIEDLLEAAALHARFDTHVQYHFWGDGAVPRVRPDNCHFHGWVSGAQKAEVIRGASVVVLPSYSEAFPIVLLEAMASGTPVVATNVGGIPDMIDPGEQGALVAPGRPEALHREITRLLSDRALWDHCSEEGRQKARAYSLATIVERWRALYASDLGGLRGRAARRPMS